MQKEAKDLVIMAAGIGSRFEGNVKQLYGVGPSGECIMDYSIYDATVAGFTRIVFVIRKEIEGLFDTLVGSRARKYCGLHNVEVVCAYQEKTALPGGIACPETRIKPWGTGHALLCCKGILQHKFAVINADDYYGRDAFIQMAAFLDNLDMNSSGLYALAGFRLSNTLSDHGGVTRGICCVDEDCQLTNIRETRNICKFPQGPAVETRERVVFLDGEAPVSMNMWAFTSDILDRLESRFCSFLENGGTAELSAEFLIPTEIGAMLNDGIQVKVIPVRTKWFGMTYRADIEYVQACLSEMVDTEQYPTPLLLTSK